MVIVIKTVIGGFFFFFFWRQDMARKGIFELEDMSAETSKMERQRKKMSDTNTIRISKKGRTTTKGITCT